MSRAGTPFVLALYPTTRGFGFVLFQGPESPFDWGVKEIRGAEKNNQVLAEVQKLIDRYSPAVLIIEETGTKESRRSMRIRTLYKSVVRLAHAEGIDVVRYTKDDIRATFASSGAQTKYAIAQVIAASIPAFAPRLPRVRKIWMSEDARQSLFDAAALGITYFRRHAMQEGSSSASRDT
jgi:Holliday junction resolvasome RuvABC endonuclease subunit